MKYSLKNICVVFGGWSLEFKRVRMADFVDFRDEFTNLPDERYNENGGFNIESLSRAEYKSLLRVTPAFLAENLISAKCGDEVAETIKDKIVLIDFLSDEEGFDVFCSGYINGEKKT